MLSGHSKAIILYLYKQCKINRKCDVLVSSESIAASTNIVMGSITTTLKRLQHSGHIKIIRAKSGAGAWRLIRLNDSIYKEILANEFRHNSDTQPDTNLPISSSYNILTTNNTTCPVDNLSKEWKAINFESLKHIGFSEDQLLQLYENKLNTPEAIQKSINHLAFGLGNVDRTKAYKDPLHVLMGVLRKGKEWDELGYRSPTAEPLKPIAEQEETKQEAAERERSEELFNRQYFKWFTELSNDELKQLFPDYDLSSNANQRFYYFEGTCRASCAEVFRKTKWMEIYNNISH